jgi:hypothetical protein
MSQTLLVGHKTNIERILTVYETLLIITKWPIPKYFISQPKLRS